MSLLARAQRSVCVTLRRNIGISAVVAQKGQANDAIQKLFLQSIREYEQKSKAAGGKIVDITPETEKDLKSELARVAKIYGGASEAEMTKFPSFSFKDPVIDPIDQAVQS